MERMPIDTQQRKIGSRANAILHYRLNYEHWVYNEIHNDPCVDVVLELSEDNKWCGHKIEGQVRGTSKLSSLKQEDVFSFQLDLLSIQHALHLHRPFVLFLVDIVQENVYYVAIQDYFIEHKEIFEKLKEQDRQTISIRIPVENLLTYEDDELQKIAASIYMDGPGIELKRLIMEQLSLDI